MENTLIGQRFGKVRVIREVPKKEGRTDRRYVYRCDCGTEREAAAYNIRRTRSCGCANAERLRKQNSGGGSKHPAWKGGRSQKKSGYVTVYVGNRGDGASPHKYEHHLVMEQHLGRELFPDETVHHKNGIRNDNRIENLQLKAGAHGQGQTIPDLVEWAREILRRYDGTDEARRCDHIEREKASITS